MTAGAALLLTPGLLAPAPAWAADPDEEKSAWLGVMLQDLTRPLRDAMDLESGLEGVMVAGVVEESPAEKAGIEEGDVLTAVDGKAVTSSEEAIDRVRALKPGAVATFTVLRDGKSQVIRVTLGEREEGVDALALDMDRLPRAPMPPVPPDVDKDFTWFEGEAPRALQLEDVEDRGFLGVSTMELNEQLAAYFDVAPGQGVLVTEVGKDSPAEKAGLRAGDVILSLNKSKVDSPRDLQRLVRAHDPEDAIEVEVVRKGTTTRLNAVLGKSEGLSGLGMGPGAHRMLLGRHEGLERNLGRLERHLRQLEKLELRDQTGMRRHREKLLKLQKEIDRPGKDDSEEPQKRVRVLRWKADGQT